jgi:hypothetical protein
MTPIDLTQEQKEARREGQKLLYDAFKHLTTLSTGSILLLITFLEKFTEPQWRPLIAVSLLGFTACTVLAFGTMLVLSDSVFKIAEETESGSRIGAMGFTLSLASFLIGIASLVVFALKNLYYKVV